MKKLMIIAAVALAAVSAQASKFNWAFMDECEAAGGDLTGYTAYLISASDWSAADLSGATGVGEVLAKAIASAPYGDWYSADCDPDNDYYYYEYTSDPITGSKAATGNDQSYYIVFDNGSKYGVMPTTGDIWADDDNNKGQNPFYGEGSLDTASFTSYSAAPGPGPEPGGVPEPTSGLLLLVGLAGMALKRKIA